jgi:hypothetical protein
VWGAFGAGIIIGLRSQTAWLTLPLVGAAIVSLAARRRIRQAALVAAALLVGLLIWLAPLLWITGGLSEYVTALRTQGGEDFAGIELLATSPSRRLLTHALEQTFMVPWDAGTLADVVVGLAVIGLAGLAWRQSRTLSVLALAFVPYLAFHLAFQEPVNIRYALPLVVPVAGLAVWGLSLAGKWATLVGGAMLVTASLAVAEPRLTAFQINASPMFRAFQDMQRALPASEEPPLVRMHHQTWWGLRRVIDWYRPIWDVGPQPFPGDREWLDVVDHFRGGGTRPVWFLADVTRTDLAVFDRRTTTLSGRYEQSADLRRLIGSARLDSVNWWSIRRPGWMLGRGWSLTPELAGMNEADRRTGGPEEAEAYLRRQPAPARVLLGGRYLGADNGPAARVSVSLDGKVVAEWRVTAHPRWFVRWIELPEGTAGGPGPYATLGVRITAESGAGGSPSVGLEQFDAGPVDQAMFAFVDGWSELEANPETGRVWRWTGAKSIIEARGVDRDQTLRISGESPLRYFDRAPELTVRAGPRVLGRFSPSTDFDLRVTLPADAVSAASGLVSLETNRTFKPSDQGSPDPRTLGLRLYSVDIR